MKKLLSILVLVAMVAVTGYGGQNITSTLTITNVPTNGCTLQLNVSDTRRATNGTTISAIWFSASTNIPNATTNLYTSLALYSPSNVSSIAITASNTLVLYGKPDAALSLVVGGFWASAAYVTNVTATAKAVVWPYTGAPVNERTNIASALVEWLNQNATNTILQTSPAMAGFVSLTNNQWLTNKTIVSPLLISPSIPAGGTLSAQNATIDLSSGGGIIFDENSAFLDSTSTNYGNMKWGSADSETITRFVDLYSSLKILTNIWLYETNRVYGVLEFDGGTLVTPTVRETLAGGIRYITDETERTNALASLSKVTNALTARLLLPITNAQLATGWTATNGTLRGSNYMEAISFIPSAITTVANGNNQIQIGSNSTYIELSGPTNAWSVNSILPGWAGRVLLIRNASSQIGEFANESGWESTAAYRVVTGTGTNASFAPNSVMQLVYSGTESRWLLVTPPNTNGFVYVSPVSSGTNYVYNSNQFGLIFSNVAIAAGVTLTNPAFYTTSTFAGTNAVLTNLYVDAAFLRTGAGSVGQIATRRADGSLGWSNAPSGTGGSNFLFSAIQFTLSGENVAIADGATMTNLNTYGTNAMYAVEVSNYLNAPGEFHAGSNSTIDDLVATYLESPEAWMGTATATNLAATNISVANLTLTKVAPSAGQVATAMADGSMTWSNAPSGSGGTNFLFAPSQFLLSGANVAIGDEPRLTNIQAAGTSAMEYIQGTNLALTGGAVLIGTDRAQGFPAIVVTGNVATASAIVIGTNGNVGMLQNPTASESVSVSGTMKANRILVDSIQAYSSNSILMFSRNSNIAIGNIAINGPASNSIFVGINAAASATNAFESVFLGYLAGSGAWNANSSLFIGLSAGDGAYAANNSQFIGKYAGQGANQANNSQFFGTYAGYNASSANNSQFSGQYCGVSAVSAANSHFAGYRSGSFASSANDSIFLGQYSGYTAVFANDSQFLGQWSGGQSTNANRSFAAGKYALFDMKSASNSIALGPYSGTNRANTLWIDGMATNIGGRSPLILGYFDTRNLFLDSHVNIYSNLTVGGTVTWAPVWQDVRIPLSATRPGATAPTARTFAGGTRAWAFDAGTEQSVEIEVQIPHGALAQWLTNASYGIVMHLHWSCTNAASTGSNVVFGFEYTAANPTNAFSATTTTIYSTNTVGVAFNHHISNMPKILTISEESAVIVGRVFRAAANASDTAPDDVYILSADAHLPISSPGSVGEFGD